MLRGSRLEPEWTSPMEQARIDILADELYAALRGRTTVTPLTERAPDITIEDAYQIQLRMIQRRVDAGETIVGKKIGVTSKVVMDMLNVNQPDFGQMTSGMVFNEGEAIRIDTMIAPRAEAEVAFMLKGDLQGPGVTVADVRRATECEITPYNPTAASTSASAPNAPSTIAPIRVGAIVVAATCAAATSSVKRISGSSLQIASRSIGSAATAGIDVRTMRPIDRDGRSGTCKYARGCSPTERTL